MRVSLKSIALFFSLGVVRTVAAGPPQTISLFSSNGTNGTFDPLNEVSTDGGATWQQATIVGGNVAWAAPISGTKWINCNSNPADACGVGAHHLQARPHNTGPPLRSQQATAHRHSP